ARGKEITGTTVTRDGGELTVHAAGNAGSVVYAAVRRGGGAAGLLRAVLPVGADEGRASAPESLPRDATFQVLLLDGAPSRMETAAGYMQVAFEARDWKTTSLP